MEFKLDVKLRDMMLLFVLISFLRVGRPWWLYEITLIARSMPLVLLFCVGPTLRTIYYISFFFSSLKREYPSFNLAIWKLLMYEFPFWNEESFFISYPAIRNWGGVLVFFFIYWTFLVNKESFMLLQPIFESKQIFYCILCILWKLFLVLSLFLFVFFFFNPRDQELISFLFLGLPK